MLLMPQTVFVTARRQARRQALHCGSGGRGRSQSPRPRVSQHACGAAVRGACPAAAAASLAASRCRRSEMGSFCSDTQFLKMHCGLLCASLAECSRQACCNTSVEIVC